MLASLVSQIAAGDVNSGRRAIRGSANADPLQRRAKAYILKRRVALRLYLRLATEVLLISISGQHLGSVDCWLCQIFTRSLGTALLSIRAFMCVTRRGFSPLEGRMLRACYWRQRRSCFVADRTLGNSVGAIELVARSKCAMCTFAAGDWGSFGNPLLGTFHPSGGCALALRRLGIGLLPG